MSYQIIKITLARSSLWETLKGGILVGIGGLREEDEIGARARLTYTFNTPYTNSRFVISKFTRLDEEKGTLRILLTLQETQSQITKTQLIESLQKAGLGRSGFYSSYNTLKEIGLITEETGKNREGRRILLTSLSGMGNVIALDLRTLQMMLDRM